MKIKIIAQFFWVLMVLFPFITLSQQNLGRQTILQFDANNHVFNAPAPPLQKSVTMKQGRSSAAFVGGVGGVSFDQVAEPGNDLLVANLALNYNGALEDGRRLELVINSKTVNIFLPDWLLAPIARYAESPYYSCVTLFGELEDHDLEAQVVEHEGRVINYHPNLQNTLLGIRLLYMDMLVIYPFASDLPKNSTGEYILGTGEPAPDIYDNNNGAYYLSQHLISAENKSGETFRSYVISDFSQQIAFYTTGDSLTISGYPYYYCWRFNRDRQGYNIQTVADKISAVYNKEIENQRRINGNEAMQSYLIDKLILLAAKYKDNFNFYQDGTFLDLINIESKEEKVNFLKLYAPESLFEVAVETEAYMNADSVVYLKPFSDLVSSKPGLFEAANPAVWNATVTTMRYAAFFRYVKINFPEAWTAFLGQVNLIDPEPRIFTPSVMYNPDSKTIDEALKNTLKK